jgi:uncharacterized membrane protein
VRRLSSEIDIARPPDEVFAFLDDPSRYCDFFIGLSQWQPLTEGLMSAGARYRVVLDVGSAHVGGTIRILRHEPGRLIAWESESGLAQSGSWRLSETPDGTHLVLTLGFELQGGPLGWLVERLAGQVVSRDLRATLLAVRRRLEYPQPGEVTV